MQHAVGFSYLQQLAALAAQNEASRARVHAARPAEVGELIALAPQAFPTFVQERHARVRAVRDGRGDFTIEMVPSGEFSLDVAETDEVTSIEVDGHIRLSLRCPGSGASVVLDVSDPVVRSGTLRAAGFRFHRGPGPCGSWVRRFANGDVHVSRLSEDGMPYDADEGITVRLFDPAGEELLAYWSLPAPRQASTANRRTGLLGLLLG